MRETVRNRMAIVAVVAVALAAFAGVAVAQGDDVDTPISGDALGRATEAALAHTGGGEVTETEVGDEDGFYEVEVTLDDGSQVDVHLDEDFTVIGQEADDDQVDDDAS